MTADVQPASHVAMSMSDETTVANLSLWRWCPAPPLELPLMPVASSSMDDSMSTFMHCCMSETEVVPAPMASCTRNSCSLSSTLSLIECMMATAHSQLETESFMLNKPEQSI